MSTQELYHWGIKGQKWGIRRFQNKDGSLTPAGRKRYEDDDDDPGGKEAAIKSGKASDVAKYKSQMSNDELRKAVDRINLERQLSSLREQEVQSGMDKVDSVMKKVGQVTNWAETGLKAYNIAAKINNSLNDRQLPVMDGGEARARAARAAADAAAEERKRHLDSLNESELNRELPNMSAEEIKRQEERLSNISKIKEKASQAEISSRARSTLRTELHAARSQEEREAAISKFYSALGRDEGQASMSDRAYVRRAREFFSERDRRRR